MIDGRVTSAGAQPRRRRERGDDGEPRGDRQPRIQFLETAHDEARLVIADFHHFLAAPEPSPECAAVHLPFVPGDSCTLDLGGVAMSRQVGLCTVVIEDGQYFGGAQVCLQ